MHGRSQLQPQQTGPLPARPKPGELFFPANHEPSLDASSLVGPLSWTSLDPGSLCVLAAHTRLLAHCYQRDSWESASLCWQADLLPLGTVFQLPGSPHFVVSLGHMGHCGAL
eukprot:6341486-Prorocentrum_lima.AAC.1